MSVIDDALKSIMEDKRFTAVAIEVVPKMCTATAYGNPEFPREVDITFTFRTRQKAEDKYDFMKEVSDE